MNENDIDNPIKYSTWSKKMHEAAQKKDILKCAVNTYSLFKKNNISKNNLDKNTYYIKGKYCIASMVLLLSQFYNWDRKSLDKFCKKMYELTDISKK